MKKFLKALRLILLVLLIILASLGVGLTGVAPPQPKSKTAVIETRKEADESKKKKQIRRSIYS